MSENLDELLAWAEQLARDAGAIMRAYFNLADKQVETKSDRTPVTIADKKINDLLIERVTTDFPEHGVLAEEGSANETRQKLWVCDPIDGTAGFILGVPTAMFSLAFVVDGVPLMAVMYEPLLDKMYTAIKGKGAQLNGAPVSVSDRNSLQGAKVGISTSPAQILRRKEFIEGLLTAGIEIVTIYGNVFKGSMIAQGRIDANLFPGRSAHDIAAEKLVIEEAGGKVTDLDGNEQRYDQKIRGAIVSNGRIHDDLVALIKAFGSENYLGY